ncbi:noncanonical pyrimidine nucleotidase, YjjG family protein [Croceivirga lutea]|uniref:YjjG family noncanonical pyrimidine nucleotidase n=1 Tax=Croceivirga lutea TaxID=1775167 RepID=UPI00163A8C32|nr:YjjG family noncanonical pyrimidine nucleotidase [Croceivirga lutea]GGG55790.1 noncanonical pyrimidine nucleotidase, YjjG family protein [Croceivirga lutea]
MYKGEVTDVFFDLDHTLWDFNTNSKLTFEKILPAHDVTVSIQDFINIYEPLNASFWKLYREEKINKEDLRYQRLKQTFDRLEVFVEDATINSLSDAYIDNLSFYENLMPHSFEILSYLRKNYRLHIITNGFREIQGRKLKNSGLSDYFNVVMDSETAGVKKPNPLIFNTAIEAANASPTKSVMIGDNLEADVLGAQRVGMKAIHYNTNNEENHEHAPIIMHLSEINQYL